ncbi:ribokinase [Solicola gregarius]|uniref:Ribokinase n=1 Tax=Solicola gregarius TaxID=2908642 RepID=A0AA46YJL2_9ACTN|nr:ribokinase [Solicola gregarius]UYM04695.1 ribokinase [Solicola gregarius]
MRPTIGVFGSANLDHVVRVRSAPRLGETITGRSYEKVVGGKGANQALAAARAGADVRMVGAVGDDDGGLAIRSVLNRGGVDTSGLATKPGPSGTAHITVDENGDNSIVVVPGANAEVRSLTDAHRAALAGCDTVLLQLELPIRAVVEAARYAHGAGVRVVLTPAPVVPLSADQVALADVLVLNEHESAELSGVAEPRAAAQALVVMGVGVVVVTLGERGSLCVAAGADEVVEEPALPVRAVDTTAAGDTFAGCLAVALAEGQDLRAATHWATCAAALSVQRVGASPSMPDRAEIERLAGSR